MPPAKKAPAKPAATAPAEQAALDQQPDDREHTNGDGPTDEPGNQQDYDGLDATRRERADEIKTTEGYQGTMTAKVLRALTPLLYEPIHPRHIETIGRLEGKPYESTGIRSLQVQVDRLTDVLGLGHYRLLPHHSADGQLCRMHVVIGNDLHWCTLTPAGELQPFTVGPAETVSKADVLAQAEGWGGHKRGSGRADIWKGSETNAGKRTIARVGPGHEVYTFDMDDDPRHPVNPAADRPAPARPQAPAPAHAVGGHQSQATFDVDAAIDWDLTLQTIRDHDDDLRPLRQECDKGMELFALTSRQRAERLRAADSAEKLTALRDQVQSALDAQAAQEAEGGG